MCLARKMGVKYVCLRCVVSSLSAVSPLAKFVRNKRKDEEVRWRRAKYIFMNRFLFAAWNIWVCFDAARLVKGCEY